MLVKLLSFIASFLSNARYKAVLIPCAILVLAFTSLTTVALVHGSNTQSAASTTSNTGAKNSQKTQESPAPQLNGMGNQDLKSETSPQLSQDSRNDSGNAAHSSSNTPNTSQQPSQSAPDFDLSAVTIKVTPEGTSSPLTAQMTDESEAAWTITPSPEANESGVTVSLERSKSVSPAIHFRFRAAPNAAIGPYQFMVNAKDLARGIDISKIVTVVVVQ